MRTRHTFGPLVVGIASGLLEPRFATKSISVALLGLSLVAYGWSTCHYVVGARHVESDLANAGHDQDVSTDNALPQEVVKR